MKTIPIYLPVEFLACIVAAAVFCLCLYLIIIFNRLRVQKRNKRNSDLFATESESIFHALFPDTKKIAKAMSVDLDQYAYYCKIARIPYDPEQLLLEKMIGFLLIGGLLFACLLFSQPLLLPVAVLLGAPLVSYRYARTKSMAEKKKREISKDLPRFIDLLQTALYIGIPVETAVMQTAQKLNGTLLSREFLEAFAESNIRSKGWGTALESVSRKYEIDALSDFSLDLVLSYEKGVNVYDSVQRKGREIKSMELTQMESNASKLTSTILIPVLLFKIAPLIVLLCYPIIVQIQRGF